MESIGKELRKAREDKGLSPEDVYSKTKIHADVIRALEDDRFQDMQPVYTKGFLKTYTRFLGLDTEEFLREYQKLVPSSASYVKKRVEVNSLKEKAVRVILNPTFKIIFKKYFILAAVIFVIGSFILLISRHKREAKLETKKAAEQAHAVSAPVAVKDSSPVKVTVRARDNCLLRVKLDGKLIYSDVFSSGMVDSWQAKDKIELYVGNAGGIDLEINGKLIPSLGRKREVIKNIVITKNGFTINK